MEKLVPLSSSAAVTAFRVCPLMAGDSPVARGRDLPAVAAAKAASMISLATCAPRSPLLSFPVSPVVLLSVADSRVTALEIGGPNKVLPTLVLLMRVLLLVLARDRPIVFVRLVGTCRLGIATGDVTLRGLEDCVARPVRVSGSKRSAVSFDDDDMKNGSRVSNRS